MTITAPFSHFDIPGIGQAYLLFRCPALLNCFLQLSVTTICRQCLT